jgi:hypothetical protein
MQFLPKFLPLLTSIESIELDDENAIARLEKKENFGQKMLTSARVLLIRSGFPINNNIVCTSPLQILEKKTFFSYMLCSA